MTTSGFNFSSLQRRHGVSLVFLRYEYSSCIQSLELKLGYSLKHSDRRSISYGLANHRLNRATHSNVTSSIMFIYYSRRKRNQNNINLCIIAECLKSLLKHYHGTQ